MCWTGILNALFIVKWKGVRLTEIFQINLVMVESSRQDYKYRPLKLYRPSRQYCCGCWYWILYYEYYITLNQYTKKLFNLLLLPPLTKRIKVIGIGVRLIFHHISWSLPKLKFTLTSFSSGVAYSMQLLFYKNCNSFYDGL